LFFSALQTNLLGLCKFSFGNSGDIRLEYRNTEFLQERLYRAEELNSLDYNAFSVAKVFEKAAKNFPWENVQIFLWNTRYRISSRKTVTSTEEFNSTVLLMRLCQKYFAKLIARIGFSNYCGTNCLIEIS
jgi:hypothetical protein